MNQGHSGGVPGAGRVGLHVFSGRTREGLATVLRASAIAISLVLLVAGSPALAQSSSSYQLTDTAVNNGGVPRDGTPLASTSFRITLDAIGGTSSAVSPASVNFVLDAGLVQSLRPAGEVGGLRFVDRTTLAWQAERSAGTYRVYRGLRSAVPGSYGACLTPAGLTDEQLADADVPATGESFVYLVAARNRLDQEGSVGSTSSGTPVSTYAPCP